MPSSSRYGRRRERRAEGLAPADNRCLREQKSQPLPVASGKGHDVDVEYTLTLYSPNAYYGNAAVWFPYNGTLVRTRERWRAGSFGVCVCVCVVTGPTRMCEQDNPQPEQCMEIWVSGSFDSWTNGAAPSEAQLAQAINGINNGMLNTMLGAR